MSAATRDVRDESVLPADLARGHGPEARVRLLQMAVAMSPTHRGNPALGAYPGGRILVAHRAFARVDFLDGQHNFTWPDAGTVEIAGWGAGLPAPYGFQGYAWGQVVTLDEFDAALGRFYDWAVVAVRPYDLLHPKGRRAAKCHYGRGEVVFRGAPTVAAAILAEYAPPGTVIPGAALEAPGLCRVGFRGRATCRDGYAIAGDGGHAIGQWAAAGDDGRLTVLRAGGATGIDAVVGRDVEPWRLYSLRGNELVAHDRDALARVLRR